MSDQVEIVMVSTEMVKPSSPTPSHLRRYNFSFLDQIAPATYMPMVLFFPEKAVFDRRKLVDRLKISLSEALTLYYPLAGQTNEAEKCVECNDEGALFVEADARSCLLSEILRDPNPSQMNNFLAVEIDDARVKELPVAVQVTFFGCGGMTVGLCVNHKVADGLSFYKFLNAWSALARANNERGLVVSPEFGSAELFPALDLGGFSSRIAIVRDCISAKRFVFDTAKISDLKARYKCTCESERGPTRVEALSAFLWQRLVASTKPKSGEDTRVCTLQHAVNLRPRMDPPLPENFFGNMSRMAQLAPSMDVEKPETCAAILKQMRDSIKQIDAESLKMLQANSDDYLSFLKQRLQQVKNREIVSISFTSLCGFPIYDADFGWGKPVYVCSAKLTFKNLIGFFDKKSGDGIEAWVYLKEEDMAKFERDQELLSYASPTTVLNVMDIINT